MTKKRKQAYTGVVYSTDSDFNYIEENSFEETTTLPPNQQNLRVSLDKKQRAGKSVTLITGFKGKSSDLDILGKRLKQKCGTGGSVKDDMIVLQGDFRKQVLELLSSEGFRVKQSGG